MISDFYVIDSNINYSVRNNYLYVIGDLFLTPNHIRMQIYIFPHNILFKPKIHWGAFKKKSAIDVGFVNGGLAIYWLYLPVQNLTSSPSSLRSKPADGDKQDITQELPYLHK